MALVPRSFYLGVAAPIFYLGVVARAVCSCSFGVFVAIAVRVFVAIAVRVFVAIAVRVENHEADVV